MPTTAHGYEYPAGGDAITTYPAAAQATAQKLEDLVKHIQSGSQISGTLAAGAGADITVTFPTPFVTVPHVVATVGPQNVTVEGRRVWVRSATTTQAVFRVHNGTGSSTTVAFNWMAQG